MKNFHLPGHTYFICSRNSSGLSSFFDDACCRFFLTRLLHSLRQFHTDLHAYCFTPDAVLMLLTPRTPTALSHLWASVSRQYESYFSCRFARNSSGLLREFHGCLILGEAAVLDTYKYIERAPLERNLCDHPGVHQWSSYCSNAFGSAFSSLKKHPELNSFLAASGIGPSDYREFLACPFSRERLEQLHNSLLHGNVFQDGNERPSIVLSLSLGPTHKHS